MADMKKTAAHWLDKGTPKFWQPRAIWRVRLMREGQQFQWLLKSGKGDASSTGKVLASAEWDGIKNEIKDKEAREAAAGEPSDPFYEWNKSTPDEQEAWALGQQQRRQYTESPLSNELAYDEYKAFQEFLAFRKAQTANVSADALKGSLGSSTAKPFSSLITVWKVSLKERYERTDKTRTLKADTDLGRARYTEYLNCLSHMEGVIGAKEIQPFGEFQISEKQLAELLKEYRETTLSERAEKKMSGSWFNERMKTARSFVSFLAAERLVSATPPNIVALTPRFEMKKTSKPMPVDVIHSLWKFSDDVFRTYMLLALNCGMRQAELAVLEAADLKTINGRLCIARNRGKTGVEYAIPLWDETIAAIKKHGRKSGLLFLNGAGQPLVTEKGSDSVYGKVQTIRNKAKAENPKVLNYSFENFRDTGASFIDGRNKVLTPLYLAQSDSRMASFYVGNIEGEISVPMNLEDVLKAFKGYLNLDFSLPPTNPMGRPKRK